MLMILDSNLLDNMLKRISITMIILITNNARGKFKGNHTESIYK